MDLDYSGRIVVRRQRKHSLIGRFLRKIVVSETRFFEGTACWEWQASRDGSGYGRFLEMGEFYAHRVSHKLFIGEIPEGFEVDHRCRNRRCESPFHLEAVPLPVNRKRRSDAITACKYGHEFNEENTYWKGETRICKTCRYRRVAKWRADHPDEAREIGRLSKAAWRAKAG